MNKELIKELELLRFYKEKGCLDTHYKILIDYIDNLDKLEKENKELHNKIDKAIEYIKRYVFMDLPQLIKLVEILKDNE